MNAYQSVVSLASFKGDFYTARYFSVLVFDPQPMIKIMMCRRREVLCMHRLAHKVAWKSRNTRCRPNFCQLG